MSITFEDVETAIKVLQKYIALSRKAESILNIAVKTKNKNINPMNFSFEDFMNMALELKKREKGILDNQQEIVDNIQFTEDEIEKIRKVKEKLKGF